MALINVAINFGYEYFSFVIYFSNIFFPKFFFQHFAYGTLEHMALKKSSYPTDQIQKNIFLNLLLDVF